MVDVDGADEVVQPQRRGRAGKKARPKPRNRNKKEVEVDDASAATNRSRGGGIRSLKLNGPVPQAPPVNVNEEIYCYCKQGSYGEVITNSIILLAIFMIFVADGCLRQRELFTRMGTKNGLVNCVLLTIGFSFIWAAWGWKSHLKTMSLGIVGIASIMLK